VDPAVAVQHVRERIGQARSALADGDLEAPVPQCPDWTLRELGLHLGEIHRWVRGAIVEGHPNTEVPPGPRDRAALLGWYDDGAGVLLDLLADTDPDAPCWAFGPKPSTVRFWLRRQVHEHAVHARDALATVGRPWTIDADVALDGVDEVVRMFFPRQVRLGRIAPLTRSLAVRPVGAGGPDGGWLLAGDGTGVPPSAGPVAADAEVSGAPDALYLLLWGRVSPADPQVSVTGDRSAAEAVLGTAIVP